MDDTTPPDPEPRRGQSWSPNRDEQAIYFIEHEAIQLRRLRWIEARARDQATAGAAPLAPEDSPTWSRDPATVARLKATYGRPDPRDKGEGNLGQRIVGRVRDFFGR